MAVFTERWPSSPASKIRQHGQELAERYLSAHENIQQYQDSMWSMQEFSDGLDVEVQAPSKENFEKLKVQRDAFRRICRFGKAFKGDYGWASSAIGSNQSYDKNHRKGSLQHGVQLDSYARSEQRCLLSDGCL